MYVINTIWIKAFFVDEIYKAFKRIFSCFLHKSLQQLQGGQERDKGEFYYAKDFFQNF